MVVDNVNQPDAVISGTYTFTNVQAPHTISVTFTQAAATITATAGAGGSITPPGVTHVALGGNLTYTITPNNGYSRATVKVDGIDQPAAVTSGTYTFLGVAHEPHDQCDVRIERVPHRDGTHRHWQLRSPGTR